MPTTHGVESSPWHPRALTPHQPHSAQQDEGRDTHLHCAKHPGTTSSPGMASSKTMVLCTEESG